MDPSSLYEIEVTAADGKPLPLRSYQGQVLLIVNVASKCGFTPQYAGLEKLFETYRDKGFTVLGFPCNQFARQEPGDMAEIQKFCQLTYDVKFPLFAKIDVNGQGEHPLYRYLKTRKKGLFGTGVIKWNFTKFLVDRKGNVLERFAPSVAPDSIKPRIEAALSH